MKIIGIRWEAMERALGLLGGKGRAVLARDVLEYMQQHESAWFVAAAFLILWACASIGGIKTSRTHAATRKNLAQEATAALQAPPGSPPSPTHNIPAAV